MQPSVGRIVHYNSEYGACAAFVILVHDQTKVDLQVFDHDGSIDHMKNVTQGEKVGQWNWPPRV